MFDNSPDDQNLLDKLVEVSTFGRDDLELNRQGKMSGLQRSRLGMMAIFYFGICVALFTLAVVALWVLFTKSHFVPFPAMLTWITLCTYGGIKWLYKTLPIWHDFQTGNVLCVSGPLRQFFTQVAGKKSTPIYALHYSIAQKFFNVALFAPKYIQQNQKCHAYYTPKSEILIGIEPI